MLALAAVSALAALLTPLDAPPVINVPVYSLATLNADGSTNMNILTYATPAGVTPRLWAVSLYRPTRSHANFLARGTGVLQLLCEPHTALAHTLGGQSGADADKAAACAAAGLAWEEPPRDETWTGDEQLLPGCASYIRLVQVGDLVPCGEHDLALCRVEAVLGQADGPTPADATSTAAMRAAGRITARGRAIAPDAPEFGQPQ